MAQYDDAEALEILTRTAAKLEGKDRNPAREKAATDLIAALKALSGKGGIQVSDFQNARFGGVMVEVKGPNTVKRVWVGHDDWGVILVAPLGRVGAPPSEKTVEVKNLRLDGTGTQLEGASLDEYFVPEPLRRRVGTAAPSPCWSRQSPTTWSCSSRAQSGTAVILGLEQPFHDVVEQCGHGPEDDDGPRRLVRQSAALGLRVLDERPDPARVVEQEPDANEGPEEDVNVERRLNERGGAQLLDRRCGVGVAPESEWEPEHPEQHVVHGVPVQPRHL
jgi:hypothetical protein